MRLPALLLALCLAGCVTMQQQARPYIEKGDYVTAISLLEQGIQRGEVRAWNDLGVVYTRMGNRERAIQAYTMGARYGDPAAQQNLISGGLPVPPADLATVRAQQRAANAAETAATMQIINTLTPPPQPIQMPRSVNCTSTRLGTTVQTNCY